MRVVTFIFLLFLYGISHSQIITPVSICNLPSTVPESSGLIKIDSVHVLTHNDSGDSSRIFLYDYINCSIVKEIIIENHTMVDFEAITKDDSGFVYIGDFGNNAGNRIDLCVLKINLYDILQDDTVTAEKIFFSYADQSNFTTSIHNFDCESMFHFNDSLYLFSKNHNVQGNYCKRYVLSDLIGNYSVSPSDSISLPTWVTDAAIDTIGNKFVLQSETNLYQFNITSDYPKLDTLRKNFLYSFASKKEGAAFKNKDTLLITDENILSTGGNVYEIDITNFVNTTNYDFEDLDLIHTGSTISCYNKFSFTLNIKGYDLIGKLVIEKNIEPNETFEYETNSRGILNINSEEYFKQIKF